MNWFVRKFANRHGVSKAAARLTTAGSTALTAIFLSILACANASAPTATPQETPPVAVAATQTWSAEPALIIVNQSAGFTSVEYAWSLTPDLVVYADGLVVGTDWQYARTGTTRQVWQATLSPGEVCDLLFQIEAIGFMDYDDDDYVPPDISDMGSTHIRVNAWRQNRINAYALDDIVDSDRDWFETPDPALADAYRLLRDFQPAAAAPYQAERVALLVYPTAPGDSVPAWPLESPSLSAMTTGLEEYEEAQQLFTGPEAAALQDLFQTDFFGYFTEGDRTYVVALRPYFPHEMWSETSGWSVRQFETTPTTEMTCAR